MNTLYKTIIISFLSISSFAQQATEIDSKSVKLPRYASLTAITNITTGIATPTQGMMVYNIETASNWYYNGTAWKNMEVSSVSIPTPLDLVSNSNTFSSETQDGTSSAIIGLNSSNGGGNGIFGQHKGNGWAGYFLGNNAISANGKTYLNGNVEIANSNWLEFGKGMTKQEDNGKIAYNAFGEANTLSIVGGGIANDGSDRKIKMWANGGTEFTGSITTAGEIKPNGVSGLPNQILKSTGNGTMQWADNFGSQSSGNVGFGPWGGCEYYNIESYNPVSNIDIQKNENFGLSVSISGDYAVMGSPYYDKDGIEDVGSATVFKRNSITKAWEPQVKLTNNILSDYQLFGQSVSISGNYILVGAPEDDQGTFVDCGSVSVYRRDEILDEWVFVQKIFDSEIASGDKFGYSVSISGNLAIVGAPFNDQFTSTFTDVGAYIIFQLNTSTGLWSQIDRGYANTPGGLAGFSVSISGEYAAVGVPFATEGTIRCGRVLVFKKNPAGNDFILQANLTNSLKNTDDAFGHSVAISENNLIVGTPYYNNTFANTGVATIFKRNNTSWGFVQLLINNEEQINSNFGISVAITENTALIGAMHVNNNKGSGLLLKKVGELWLTHQYIKNPIYVSGGNFGKSVALNHDPNNDFLIGSPTLFSGVSFFGKIK